MVNIDNDNFNNTFNKDIDNIKIKGLNRSLIKNKLSIKGVKHGYGQRGKDILELQNTNLSRSMKNEMILKPMGLTKKKSKKNKLM